MDTTLGTLAVARVLVRMAEHRGTGLFHVHAGPRRVSLAIRGGRLYGVEGTGHAALGDMLLAQRPRDAVFAARLASVRGAGAVGSALVEQGAVSAQALCDALCALHAARLRWLFAHAELRCGVLAPLPALGARLRASVPLGLAVREALAQVHASGPATDGLGRVRHGPGRRSYALLAEKRRAIARGSDPAQLLGVDKGADRTEARERLRALAGRVHPDLFRSSHPQLADEADIVLASLTRAAAGFPARARP